MSVFTLSTDSPRLSMQRFTHTNAPLEQIKSGTFCCLKCPFNYGAPMF